MKKNIVILISVFLAIVAIIVAVLIGVKINNKNFKNDIENGVSNLSEESNESNIEVANDKEIIKVGIQYGERAYILDVAGRLYACGNRIGNKFVKILEGVKDVTETALGPAVTLTNNETYIISDLSGLKYTDKTIDTEMGTGKRLEVDDKIIDFVPEGILLEGNYIQCLTEKGEVYKILNDDSTKNAEKINENVKKISSNKLNISFIDNKNDAYVYGYNVTKEGILGTSKDYDVYKYNVVMDPVLVGSDIRDIITLSDLNFGALEIFALNNKNELFVMGRGKTSKNIISLLEKDINKLTKIDDDVKEMYPMLDSVLIKKNDNSLYIFYGFENSKNRKIMDNVKTVVTPAGYGGAFIINDKNELWAFGRNDGGKFGIGEDIKTADEPIKVNTDVKRVFVSKSLSSSEVFIVKTDGSLYSAGVNHYKSLGVGDVEKVSTWTKVEY